VRIRLADVKLRLCQVCQAGLKWFEIVLTNFPPDQAAKNHEDSTQEDPTAQGVGRTFEQAADHVQQLQEEFKEVAHSEVNLRRGPVLTYYNWEENFY